MLPIPNLTRLKEQGKRDSGKRVDDYKVEIIGNLFFLDIFFPRLFLHQCSFVSRLNFSGREFLNYYVTLYFDFTGKVEMVIFAE